MHESVHSSPWQVLCSFVLTVAFTHPAATTTLLLLFISVRVAPPKKLTLSPTSVASKLLQAQTLFNGIGMALISVWELARRATERPLIISSLLESIPESGTNQEHLDPVSS